jgi:ATP-dependent exoDNAse (exonuclease V) beta subunit
VDAAGARFVFAVRRASEAKSGTATPAAESLDLERVRSDSEWLRRKKSEADARMVLRFSTSASQVAHDVDDDTPVARADHSETRGRSDSGMGRVAGIAVHRILETFAFDTDPDAELAKKGEELDDVLRPHVPVERLDDAVRFTRERVEKLRAGTLLRRLYDLREHIVARELPVLLAAESGDPSVEVLSGTIDLVYRDPRTEEWVIVDYKTDDVGADGDAALSERTRRYAEQGAIYQRAIRDAFGLDAMPRFELWYLSHDRLIDASEAISEAKV